MPVITSGASVTLTQPACVKPHIGASGQTHDALPSLPDNGSALLKQWAQSQRKLLYRSVGFGAFATLSMLAQWISLAWILHASIILGANLAQLSFAFVVFGVSALLKVSSARMQVHCAQQASNAVKSDARHLLNAHWLHRSPLDDNQQSPAGAATQWVEEVEALDGYFSQYWPQQMLSVLSPLIIVCTVAYFNWLCAVLLLISAPLIPLFMILVGMGAEHINQRYFVMRQRLAGHFFDRVKHIVTIQQLQAQQATLEDLRNKGEDYREVIMRTLKVAFLSSTVLEFFTSVAIASVAIYVGFSLFGAITWGPAESLSLFSGLSILLLAPEFFQPLRTLSQFYHDRASALASCNNLLTSCQQIQHSQQDTQAKRTYVNAEEALSMVQWQVADASGNALLKPLTLAIQKGQILLLTGPSGCGKTTFLHNLAGYLAAYGGDVCIPIAHADLALTQTQPKQGNDKPLADAQLAYCPQKPWIHQGTVIEALHDFVNQKSDLKDASEHAPNTRHSHSLESIQSEVLNKRVEDVLTQLDLPEHTQCTHLSGGQQQRLGLARVLLTPTPLILLDEPTSALDKANRQRVIRLIQELKPDALIVIASHDSDFLDIADHHLDLSSLILNDQSEGHLSSENEHLIKPHNTQTLSAQDV